jgi:phage tail sheath protein FI
MVQVNYPGVYIVEKPSGVHTITGVATSIAAFVGFTGKGAPNRAVTITSFADFERQYGGLYRDSPVSYGVRQFFTNGGTQAIIVRVASGFATASWTFNDSAPAAVLDVAAASPGAWGNDLRLTIDDTNVRKSGCRLQSCRPTIAAGWNARGARDASQPQHGLAVLSICRVRGQECICFDNGHTPGRAGFYAGRNGGKRRRADFPAEPQRQRH